MIQIGCRERFLCTVVMEPRSIAQKLSSVSAVTMRKSILHLVRAWGRKLSYIRRQAGNVRSLIVLPNHLQNSHSQLKSYAKLPKSFLRLLKQTINTCRKYAQSYRFEYHDKYSRATVILRSSPKQLKLRQLWLRHIAARKEKFLRFSSEK